jgi:hypothetical protein
MRRMKKVIWSSVIVESIIEFIGVRGRKISRDDDIFLIGRSAEHTRRLSQVLIKRQPTSADKESCRPFRHDTESLHKRCFVGLCRVAP